MQIQCFAVSVVPALPQHDVQRQVNSLRANTIVCPLPDRVRRDKLPDAGSPYEGEGGSVDDSVEFVLENFIEANKLWVRMHGQVREGGRGGERGDLSTMRGRGV